jgi:hypothetical protein
MIRYSIIFVAIGVCAFGVHACGSGAAPATATETHEEGEKHHV